VTIRLHYSLLSPFARKVRVFAAEAGLADRLELAPCDIWAPGCAVADVNPLGKVPVLETPDGTFIGSRLCCEYLDSLHASAPLIPSPGAASWRILQLEALADGVMEAAVAHVTERLRRPAQFVYPGWLDRQAGKVERTLAVLAADFEVPGSRVDIASITLACALSYLDIRLPELAWRSGRQSLADWQLGFEARPSMSATYPASID